MPEISEAIRAEVENLKDVIGWSWLEVSKRLGWGPQTLAQFRSLRLAATEGQVAYMREAASAIESVTPVVDRPGPVVEAAVPNEIEDGLRAAGMHPAPSQEVKVMLLADIAAKLAAEYRAISANDEMNADERAGAIWCIGMMAKRLGVEDEVKALIRPAAAVPRFEPQPIDPAQRPYTPPPEPLMGRIPFPV